ncbi:MAG: hypothetical protein ACLP8S_16950 [Solirubrobacteraceae bacterium]
MLAPLLLLAPPPFADAASHPALFGLALLSGLVVGVYGHLTHSRPLIVVGIVVIGVISLYFVAAGEVASFSK